MPWDSIRNERCFGGKKSETVAHEKIKHTKTEDTHYPLNSQPEMWKVINERADI